MYDPREVLVKSLYSLTPGGSEFHNDPDRCIQWIKARLATVTEQVKKRQQAEADNAALVQYLESLLEYESIIWMHGYIKDIVNKHHPGAALLEELERLQAVAEAAKEIEWVYGGDNPEGMWLCCPCCGKGEVDGHSADCKLHIALIAAGYGGEE